MARKITVGKQEKYRIKKTIRSLTAPMGIDYTPETFENGQWVPLSPACYKENDALDVLKNKKLADDVKVEYIYPKL